VAYLDPPPFPAPVVVMKDVGGLVADYQARTEQYRAEGREVRLHECRSACTLALSLPNVCVYPSSLLKFHKAYDWNTKVRDEAVSAQLMSSYPPAIQARLGGLTREYRVLTGAELIALGVRDCNADQILIARVKPAPAPKSTPGDGDLFGSVLPMLSPPPTQEPAVAPKGSFTPAQTVAAKSAPALEAPAADARSLDPIPLPPRRPSDLSGVALLASVAVDAPTPPRRPADLPRPIPGLPKLIEGAQPTLPYGVLSYTAFGR
jgi:hypothetical protein